MRRRCSSCWRAPTTSGPATGPSSESLWPQRRGRARTGSTATATATATGSSSTSGSRPTACSTRAGRTRTTPSSTPTARPARGPIALCEVQGYVYAARRAARGAGRRRSGTTERAGELTRQAEELRAALRAGLLVRGAVRPTPWPWTATSGRAGCGRPTPGIACSPASPTRSAPGASPRTLLAPDSFSGWGVRTLAAAREPLQPDGLPQRLGLAARQRPDRLRAGALWAGRSRRCGSGPGCSRPGLHFDLHRMPELFCGFAREPGEGPTLYPVACAPQAWSAARSSCCCRRASGCG